MTTQASAPTAQPKTRRKATALPDQAGVRVASLDVSMSDLAGLASSEVDARVLLNDTIPSTDVAEEDPHASAVDQDAPKKASPTPRAGFAPRPGVRDAVREVHIDTPFSTPPRKLEASLRHLPHVLAVDTLNHEPPVLKHQSRSGR